MLLNEYKISKAAESINWELVKTKCSDIFNLFIAALPDSGSNAPKSFPRMKDEITKQIILTLKLKSISIRLKFCQAIDSSRRSVHGQVSNGHGLL